MSNIPLPARLREAAAAARGTDALGGNVPGRLADLLDTIADEYGRAQPCTAGCAGQGEQVWSWPLAGYLADAILASTPAVAG